MICVMLFLLIAPFMIEQHIRDGHFNWLMRWQNERKLAKVKR